MRNIQKFLSIAMVIVLTALVAGGTMAQERRTITVTGEGAAFGNPDMATVEIGVTAANASIGEAYSEVNANIENVINALVAQGVARDDIRTVDFNIYTDERQGETPDDIQRLFRVSNRLSVTVRDVDNIESVIDAAINAGANNIFGLNFTIQDTATLESEARIKAFEHARLRAEEIASAVGVTVGQVVSVTENANNFPSPVADAVRSQMGGGGAVIEQGSLSISVSVSVTYEIGE